MTIDNDDLLNSIIASLGRIDTISVDEIPGIDLYMDQLTSFMDERLKKTTRYPESDKILTKTMINNYTKNDVLPPPIKKKYSKDHMCLLILLYYFKNVLSIDDIQKIFHPLKEMFYDDKSKSIGIDEIYSQIFTMEKKMTDKLTKDVLRRFQTSQEMFRDVKDEDEKDYLSRFAFICLLSFDAYLKKQMVERLIDDTLSEI